MRRPLRGPDRKGRMTIETGRTILAAAGTALDQAGDRVPADLRCGDGGAPPGASAAGAVHALRAGAGGGLAAGPAGA